MSTSSPPNSVKAEMKPLSAAHETTFLALNIFDIFFLLFAFLSFCLAVADASAGTHKYDVINVKSSHNEIGASVITIVYLLIGIIRQLFSWRQYNGVGQYYCHLAILTAILLVLSVLTVIFGPSIFGVLALIFNLAYFVLITMMYNNVY